MTQVTIQVGGMSCQGCVKGVTTALQAVPGVQAVSVTLTPGVATVDFDPQCTDAAALRQAVEAAGFDAA